MKKILDTKVINVNPKNEINKITYIKQDFEIKGIEYKNKQEIGVYFKTIKKDALFFTLECIGIYTNLSKKTYNQIVKLCDQMEYRRF